MSRSSQVHFLRHLILQSTRVLPTALSRRSPKGKARGARRLVRVLPPFLGGLFL